MRIAFRTFAAAALLALASTAASAAPDAVLPSTPKTVLRGYISADSPPVLRIKSGQTVKIDTLSHGGLTEDPVAFFGAVGIKPDEVLQDAKDVAKLPRTDGFGGHVLTGPIYIEGAEPGDMLEVRILKVDVRVPYGVNNPGPAGAAPGLVAERLSKVIKFDMARRVALFSDGVEVPLRPFMGIMAVAPGDPRRVGSRAPGQFGGNMDFARLTAGSTLYLPVLQPGALFVTGDSHAAQGDGEVDGNAIEAPMSPTLQFIVHKGEGKAMIGPRAEDADNYYVMGLDPDLNVALKNAVTATVNFLHETKGLSMSDAYSLSSVAVNFGVAEAVDQNLVVYGEIPKRLFKARTSYWASPK